MIVFPLSLNHLSPHSFPLFSFLSFLSPLTTSSVPMHWSTIPPLPPLPSTLRFHPWLLISPAITESDSAPVTMTPDSKSMEKMLEKLLILDFARQGFVVPGAFGTGSNANSNTSTPISQLGVGTLSFGIKNNSSGGSKSVVSHECLFWISFICVGSLSLAL